MSTNSLSPLDIIDPASLSPQTANHSPQGIGAGPKGPAKHVTLIRPAMVSSVGTWSSPVTPPLGLAYLARTLLSNGSTVAVVDAIGEKIDQFIRDDFYVYQGLTIEETIDRIDPSTNLIGLSCMFTQDWPWIRLMIRAIRARFPETIIIAGGEHITALPEFSLRDAPELDYCVLGEGEQAIVDFVNALDDPERLEEVTGLAFLRGDEVVRTKPRARIRDVDAVGYPAWHLFPMENYLTSRNAHGVFLGRTMGILATRGCPYKCTFCSNPVMYGNLWMARSPKDVLDEIQHDIETYQAENIDFYDLTMILKRSWIIEFCKLIVERGMKFTWQLPTGTRSEVIDDEVSGWLYRTGCRNITYAPESGSEETLKLIKKQVHVPKVIESIKAALRNGIHVKCNIIIGFPHETRRHVIETMKFVWRLAVIGTHDVGIFMFSPYPGSALFKELQEEGRIGGLNEDYFKSLVAFMDPLAPQAYCRHVSGRELAIWRFFGMASFFALSFLIRPWRFIKLVRNLIRNESDTVLEQRLGAILRRHAVRKDNAPVSAATVSATA